MKLKRLTLFAAAGLTCLGLLAVPAKRGTRTFTQADGSTISLNLMGDEFFHTFCTTDGLPVERKADGNFYYRNIGGVTDIIAHDASTRGDSEKAFVQSSMADVSVSKLAAARRADTNARKAPLRSTKRKASQVPSSGSPRVPILLVEYKDYKFKDSDPKATFTEFFKDGAVSAHQYFVDQSNGLYDPQFDVYGPFTLANNRASYGGNDYYGDDKGVGRMVGEGCIGLDSQIDYSKYDNDGDGECDVVIVVYAGDGEASSHEDDCEDAVWPCQWSLLDSDYGKTLTRDNTLINRFAVFNELNGADLSKIDGIGTFCHEFSHCLDLPDFYDTNYSGHFGMANWSLMDAGSYNNDGYTPVGYSAYEKAFMGWIELDEGAENTMYNLPVFNKKQAGTDKAVKLTNPNDPDEYYIIENRAKQGWDKYMPAEGLMITHVTYSESAWQNNCVNDYDLQRMTIIPADNNLKMDKDTYYGETYYIVNEDDLAGDLWPYGNKNELTDTSEPAAKVNTGGHMGKPVTEITRNADGTISFWVMKAPKPAVATPAISGHDVKSGTSFTVNWQPGDDNDVTYTLEVAEHKDITYELIHSADFTKNDHGWSSTGYTATETDAAATRLGSNNNLGSLTSPQLTSGVNGLVTVIVNAKYYKNDGSQLKISLLSASGSSLDSETIDLSDNYEDYAMLLNGPANSAIKIELETTAKKKRVYVTSAEIYTGDATSLVEAKAKATETGDATSRTITGITGSSYTVENLKGNGIYDYRLKAVPVDAETFGDSPWTETFTVELSGVNSISTVNASDNAPAEYYNLQGAKVNRDALLPGIYIVKRGNSASKILIK